MSEEKTHIVPFKVQLIVLAALIGFTIISVLVTRLEFGTLNTLVAMLIAGTKSFIVLAWYMHLKYEKRLLPMLVAGVIIILLLVMFVTFFDYSYR